ncbi:hypothetical protein EGI22_05285 [Lacihabitans sp. LS3-19]|nr:hypothetical protein [Lacihabitans sp. LS3-19]
MENKPKEQKLFLLFVVLLVLLNFPILSIMQSNGYIGSVPAKIIILFSIWLIVILLSAFFVNRIK